MCEKSCPILFAMPNSLTHFFDQKANLKCYWQTKPLLVPMTVLLCSMGKLSLNFEREPALNLSSRDKSTSMWRVLLREWHFSPSRVEWLFSGLNLSVPLVTYVKPDLYQLVNRSKTSSFICRPTNLLFSISLRCLWFVSSVASKVLASNTSTTPGYWLFSLYVEEGEGKRDKFSSLGRCKAKSAGFTAI